MKDEALVCKNCGSSDWEYIGAYDSFRNWVKCKKCGFRTIIDIEDKK